MPARRLHHNTGQGATTAFEEENPPSGSFMVPHNCHKPRIAHRFGTLLAGLGLLTIAGCMQNVTSPALSIWAGDDFHPGSPRQEIDVDSTVYDPVARRISLAGAVNETLGLHLVVMADGAAVPAVDVTLSDLESGDARIPAVAARLFRLHSVQVDRWPGWHIRLLEPDHRLPVVPDVVVPADAPVGGLPADVAADAPLHVWVDVQLPPDAPPGTYDGTLSVRSQGRTVQTVRLSLTVWPFAVPDDAGLVLMTAVDQTALFAQHIQQDGRPYAPDRIYVDNPRRGELESVLAAAMRLLESHRLSPTLPRLFPVAKVDIDQTVNVDWADYDRVVLSFLDGSRYDRRRPSPVWPIPFDASFPPPPSYGPLDSPTYAAIVRRYLHECATHFDKLNALDRAFVTIPFASTPDAEGFRAIEHFGPLIRDAHPRLRRLARLFPQDMNAYGWQGFPFRDVARQTDIWCPPAQFCDPSLQPAGPLMPQTWWFQLDRPPFSGSLHITAPPVCTRVVPWQGYRLGVPVIDLGPANLPLANAADPTPQRCIDEHPSLLLYPGTPFGLSAPVASVRLKRLRRGMQDVALLRLLEQQNLPHVAINLAESLVPRAGASACGVHFADGAPGAWVHDERWWRLARLVLADELLQTLERPTSPFRGSLRWQRLMAETRNVELKVDGVRCRPAGRRAEEGVVIEAQVTVSNRTRLPVTGGAAFEELPLGWVADPPAVDVPRIDPGSAARVLLTARAAAVTWDEDGVRYLPIRFDLNRQTIRLNSRMAYVPAARLDRPIDIDGDLSDWPITPGNLAADFVLISGERPSEDGKPAGRPAAATRCRVARDAEHLYFGFICEASGDPDLEARSNLVHYDDMVPTGEELVEILLDPLSTGTRSTGDLYHVVVKLSGAVWERGIGAFPPTGPREVWAADIRQAVRWYGDRWEAEVQIPLAAFDEGARLNRIWAVNFTRFDAARQEYSTWSGAVGNAYDPLSLGNLGL